jgi:electron transport complex protein RnfD
MSKDTSLHLLLTTSPFIKDRADTAWIMWQVNLSLIPVVIASVWYFGPGALLTIVVATAGATLPEWLFGRARKARPLRDGSAVITGLLLALTLPPGLPLWMAFVGGAVSVVLGKLIFGGIGYSVFNPALVGRAFLQAAFPAAMTSFVANGYSNWHTTAFAWPFLRSTVDAVSTPTPLSAFKFDAVVTPVADLLLGDVPGSLGETSAVLILLGGLYLAIRGVLNWRIPTAVFAGTFAAGTVLHMMDPAFADGTFHLFSGGLMLGAVYMATDPVTSPNSQLGCWIFGVGIGILVVIIRVFGGLPEGVMYAILLMNALSPVINRLTQPRTFGTRRHPSWTR